MKTQSLSFWSLNAYLFFEYVRPQSIYAVLDGLPFGQITLLLAMFAFVNEGHKVLWANSETKLIIAFLIVVFASSIFAYSPAASFDYLSVFLIWVLVYFLVTSIINTENRFFIFLLAFML